MVSRILQSRRIAILALLLGLSACSDSRQRNAAGASKQRAAERDTLRVGAWNIEWLGTPGSRSGVSKDVKQTPEDLADYILAANVDILGVCEVAQESSDGSLTSDTIAAALRIVGQKRGGAWTHQLFPARSGRNQLCGLAWDTSVVSVKSPMVAATCADPVEGDEKIWSRPPPVVVFSTGDARTDFAVVMVHMKSNYNGDFAEQRGREAHHLAKDLPRTVADRDIVIMGDTNCNKTTEPAIAELCNAGFVHLTPDDARTFWKGNGALDRVFVPADQPEFAGRKYEIVRDDYLAKRSLTIDDFKKRYSDHFMVVTEVRVMRDDD
ncbi:MAG: hypothetical protein JNG88_06300 [Phycisphaerales bacterium]|nr:hypothetical protein [Phycisphaerales bacterium]